MLPALILHALQLPKKVDVDDRSFHVITVDNIDQYNPLVIYYSNDYCSQCRVGQKRMEYFSTLIGEVYFGIVYCEEQPEICRAHNVSVVPAVKIKIYDSLFDYQSSDDKYRHEDVRNFVDRYTRSMFSNVSSEEELREAAVQSAFDAYVAIYDVEDKIEFYEPLLFNFLKKKVKFGFFSVGNREQARIVGTREKIQTEYSFDMDNQTAVKQFIYRQICPIFGKVQFRVLQDRELVGYERVYALVVRDASHAQNFIYPVRNLLVGMMRGGESLSGFCYVLQSDRILRNFTGELDTQQGEVGLIELRANGAKTAYRYRTLQEQNVLESVRRLFGRAELDGWEKSAMVNSNELFQRPEIKAGQGVVWDRGSSA